MTVFLVIVAMICISIGTACIVSLYYDYKAGNKAVQKDVKMIKRAATKVFYGMICSIPTIVISVTFTLVWLLG